jgi:GH15 family glucan-1,4-alpha-glucosidase
MTEKKHQYEMGVIGNCSYLAYIDKRANVSWMCWPKFDSSFIFGSLLDRDKGGEFSITPAESEFSSRQYYRSNTNVLCTEFESKDGKFKVTDFAPRFSQYDRYYKPLMLIRKIEPLGGSVRIRVICEPVGDYGKKKGKAHLGSNHIYYSGLERETRLTTNIPLNYIQEGISFNLTTTKYMVLTFGQPLEAPLEMTSEDFLRNTMNYWRIWVKHCNVRNLWQEQVIRSALVLKIHQYEDTGAIIASGTTSLPEHPGSTRNWDYRYCWMRDTYYTLQALYDIGHFEELENYSSFIQNIATKENMRYNPVYSIMGDDKFAERTIDLEGYLGNQPVRVGNQALEHIQNDVYGQILVSLLPLYIDGRLIDREKSRSVQLIYNLLHGIEATMYEPDAGLWEFRNNSQMHCYTFLFHWAGSSAAIRIGQEMKDEQMVQKATQLREQAIQQIEACYNPTLKAYTQAIGNTQMDASLLKLITMNYLDPTSERAAQHLDRVQQELMSEDGLFYRYKHADDFGKPKSTFLVCAYWHVEALACVGRIDEAVRYFEELLAYTNALGLLSEDVDSSDGSQWGNFPQTYSHVGLINAAVRVSRKLDHPGFLVV